MHLERLEDGGSWILLNSLEEDVVMEKEEDRFGRILEEGEMEKKGLK